MNLKTKLKNIKTRFKAASKAFLAPAWVAEDEQGHPFSHDYHLLHHTSINPCYIGRAAVYLASDYFSKFTTGTILKIDAGVSLYNYRVAQHPPE